MNLYNNHDFSQQLINQFTKYIESTKKELELYEEIPQLYEFVFDKYVSCPWEENKNSNLILYKNVPVNPDSVLKKMVRLENLDSGLYEIIQSVSSTSMDILFPNNPFLYLNLIEELYYLKLQVIKLKTSYNLSYYDDVKKNFEESKDPETQRLEG
jgi:hypothetical protein